MPEPFGPTSPTWSPSKMPNERPSKSGAAPKALVSSWPDSRSSGNRGPALADQGFLVAPPQPLDPVLFTKRQAPRSYGHRPQDDDGQARPGVARGSARLVLLQPERRGPWPRPYRRCHRRSAGCRRKPHAIIERDARSGTRLALRTATTRALVPGAPTKRRLVWRCRRTSRWHPTASGKPYRRSLHWPRGPDVGRNEGDKA